MSSEKKNEIRTAFNRMNRAEFQAHFIKTNPHRSKKWLAREWDSVMERRREDGFEVWPNPWEDAPGYVFIGADLASGLDVGSACMQCNVVSTDNPPIDPENLWQCQTCGRIAFS